MALLEEAVRRQPALAEAHYDLGLWHDAEGRWSRAEDEFEEALRIGMPLPDEVDTHDRLVRLYGTTGDPIRARHHRDERERKRALTWGE